MSLMQQTHGQWQIVFGILAGSYIFGSLAFLFFGKGEIQPWNNPPERDAVMSEKDAEEGVPLKKSSSMIKNWFGVGTEDDDIRKLLTPILFCGRTLYTYARTQTDEHPNTCILCLLQNWIIFCVSVYSLYDDRWINDVWKITHTFCYSQQFHLISLFCLIYLF